ncbi:ABC transporter substrate-binding protein [Candidatus Cloacimonadota bacterium]
MYKLIIFILIVFLLLPGCLKKVTNGTILIGHPGDFSGSYSFYDLPLRNGALFAIEEINAAGGVLGKSFELIANDCKNEEELGIQLVEEMISNGVAYIIGTTGDPILAQGNTACEAGIPISTGDGTAPTLVGEMGNCAFQICMSDNIQGAMAAEYAFKQGYRNAYSIYSEETPYTKNLPMYFQEAFEKLGGKVIGSKLYQIEIGDFTDLITDLVDLKSKPDFIFTPMYLPDTPAFMYQLRAAGVNYPVISTDGNHDESLLLTGEAIEGLIFTTHGFPAKGNNADELWEKYKVKTGDYPANIAFAVGYDEIYYLKQVIESVNSADPDKIISGLSKESSFDGVLGTYLMDPETRRVKKPVTIIGVKKGAFEFIDQFYPEYVPDI